METERLDPTGKTLKHPYAMLYRPTVISPGNDPDECLLMVFATSSKKKAKRLFRSYDSNGFRDMKFINLQRRICGAQK